MSRGVQVRDGRHNRADFEHVSLEYVDESCYFEGIICAGGIVMEANSMTWFSSGWKRFRELLPLLILRGVFLSNKGKLYCACV